MKADDPTLADRIHLRTLVEHGISPLLKMEPAGVLRAMLGEKLPPEPVFVNLSAEQLERCIRAAGRILAEPRNEAARPDETRSVTLPREERLAYTSLETARLLGIDRCTLWRLCKRGLIRPSVALRRPLFAAEEIERFLKDTRAL